MGFSCLDFPLMVSSNSSIFHTLEGDFQAISIGISFGSLDMIIGISKLRDLRDTGAMLDQLSCEATLWGRGQFAEFISSRAVKRASNFLPIA